jgi:hypothetical protein
MTYCLDDTNGPSIGCPLLFVRSATRVKRIHFLLSKGPSIGSPLLFVRCATREKNINFLLSKGSSIRSHMVLNAVLRV